MKVTILTLGTRGDVQPYVALGKGLINKGHEVTICTGPSFESFIRDEGISFYPASIDFMEILKTPEGQAIFNGGGNIFKTIKFAKEVINPQFRKSFDDFLQASRGADLIIYHPKAMAAADIAEYLDIPCVSMPPVPMIYPISEFPSLAVSADKNFGSFLNKLTYKTVKFSESSNIGDINDFREKSLGLKKRKMGAYAYQLNDKKIPIFYPISHYLFEDVTSWQGQVSLPGFFFLDSPQGLQGDLETFMATGQAPIVISFSSMPMKEPELFKRHLISALKKTGNRAVVLTGISGLSFEGYEEVLAIDKAPHRHLFKRAKGIIHHGGVGTMAEALLSGKPQVIMPFNVDQPFWAHRLFSKGLALKPLNEKTLSEGVLIETFRAFDSEEVILKAKEIGDKIASENGIETCVSYLEKLVEDLDA